jgi:BMFP domain-containing protein YqiC
MPGFLISARTFILKIQIKRTVRAESERHPTGHGEAIEWIGDLEPFWVVERDRPERVQRFFDELGKLITDAAGAVDGVRKEIEGVVRSQAERVLRDLDVVQREEFEAVKAMAQKAREENEQLKKRIQMLEAIIADAKANKTA